MTGSAPRSPPRPTPSSTTGPWTSSASCCPPTKSPAATIDGWPLCFSRAVGRGKVVFTTLGAAPGPGRASPARPRRRARRGSRCRPDRRSAVPFRRFPHSARCPGSSPRPGERAARSNEKDPFAPAVIDPALRPEPARPGRVWPSSASRSKTRSAIRSSAAAPWSSSSPPSCALALVLGLALTGRARREWLGWLVPGLACSAAGRVRAAGRAVAAVGRRRPWRSARSSIRRPASRRRRCAGCWRCTGRPAGRPRSAAAQGRAVRGRSARPGGADAAAADRRIWTPGAGTGWRCRPASEWRRSRSTSRPASPVRAVARLRQGRPGRAAVGRAVPQRLRRPAGHARRPAPARAPGQRRPVHRRAAGRPARRAVPRPEPC